MSGEGLGKIKPKRAHTPKKPYDRSKSFLGKIKDSVKDLLIPSWLIRSSDNEASSSSSTPSQVLTSEGHIGTELYSGLQAPNYRSSSNETDQIPRFNEMTRQQPITVNSPGHSRHSFVGESYMNDFGPAPNVNIATLEQQNVSWPAKGESPIAKLGGVLQQDSKRRKIDDSARLRMSESYLEEAPDVASDTAPTGQIMMSTSVSKKQSPKQGSSTPQLWSPESVRLRKALVPPVTDKPAFNSFLFSSSSSKANNTSFGDSSFYSGKTCYGGSAARRKKAANTLPYQSSLPLRKQVTANRMNTSLNATTSSTAQRILETLDRMSTPLGDAKKIPQDESTIDSLISFKPSSYRRVSSIGSMRSATRPLQLPDRGPPTAQHQRLSQVAIARNRNKVTGVDGRQRAEDNSELPVSQDIMSVTETRPSTLRDSQSAQTPASGGTGKLKSKKFSHHLSSRKDEEDEITVVPELSTNFTLPVSNINPISFTSPPPKHVTSSASNIPLRDGTSAPVQFTFSTPIEERRPSLCNQSLNNSDKGFKFSSPIKASQAKINAAGAEGGSKTIPEPAVGASSVVPMASFSTSIPAWGSTAPKPKLASPDIGGTSSSFKSYSKWSGFNKDSSDVASPSGFSLSPATSLKSGSVMDILGGKASSTVAPTGEKVPKTSPPPLKEDDLMGKAKKAPGLLDGDTNMLSKKPEADKFVDSETPKPGAEPAKETQEPAQKSLSDMFKPPPGSWECDICMVQNPGTASRCVACDSPRPGFESGGIESKDTESKKSENSTSAVVFASGGGFVINTSTTSTGSCGFKFGNSNNSSAPATSLPAPTGFVFGQSGATSSTSTTTTVNSETRGFKFGSMPISTSTNGPGIAASVPSSTTGLSFGGGISKTSMALSSSTTAVTSVQFGVVRSTASDSSKSDNISPVVEITNMGTWNSSKTSNGLGSLQSNKLSTSSFVFGGVSAAPSSELTTVASTSVNSATTTTPSLQSQINFNFVAPKPATLSAAPLSSAAAPETSFSSTKPASGLFQFGVTPAGSTMNTTGLGMGPSLSDSKARVNGDFSPPGALDCKASNIVTDRLDFVGASAFGGFEKNSSSAGASTSQVSVVTNRAVESEESSAKKAFKFGASDGQSSLNGGFHFGGAAQTSTLMFGGNAAGAAAPTPAQTGAFIFGSSSKDPAPLPSGPAKGGGFQFGTGSANVGFNFGQGTSVPKVSFNAGGLPPNFNFGAGSQSSSVPFQFNAKPTDNATSAPLPSMPFQGSFSNGPKDPGQRKMKRAVRRIQRN